MRLIYALSLPSRRLQQRLENLVGGRNHLRRRLIRLLESQQVRGLFIEIDAGHRVTRSRGLRLHRRLRSEEHTSELQSLMRISYAVFCLKKKNIQTKQQHIG